MTETSKEAIDRLVQHLREATNTKGRIRGGAGGQTIECTMRSTFHEVSLWALDETIDALTALQAERDRQYDQNVEQIARMAALEAERDAFQGALTLIERLYYIEDKDAEWRASRMNGVAREAQDGNDLDHYRRIFPRAALSTDTKGE